MTDTAATTAYDHEAHGWSLRLRMVTFPEGAGPGLAGRTLPRWAAVKDGRELMAGYESLPDILAAVDERIRDDEPVDVAFADGTALTMRRGTAAMVVGLDRYGNAVAEDPDLPGFPYPLTPCHHATGKGWTDEDGEGMVVCRACMAWVDDYFGGFAEVAVPRAGA